MPLFTGKVDTDSSFKQLLGTFKVTLRYLRKLETENFPIETTVPVAANGSFQLDIDNDARQDGAATVTVAGPTSETLFGSLLSDLLDANNQLKPIKILGTAPRIALTGLPPAELIPVRRLSVRVFIADNGALTGKPAARTYVQLLGTPTGQATLAPIGSGTTDAAGYLSLSIPAVSFERLIARTGQPNAQTDTEVSLLEDGTAPDKIILTVPQASEGGEDCNCDLVPPRLPDATELAENSDVFSTDLGAGCEDFTVPNRTLEEFDFYRIVRTTDPDIRGLTLPDTVTAEIADSHMIKVVFDRGTLSSHLRTSDLSLLATEVNPATASQPVRERRSAVSISSRSSFAARSAGSQPSPENLVAEAEVELTDILPAYVDVRPLEAEGTVTSALWRDATNEKTAEAALKSSLANIPAAALQSALQDPDGFTPVSLMTLERRSSVEALLKYFQARQKTVSGRGELTQENSIDWDDTSEFFQATSIAHGHLLHFKQEWKADGYSLGELVKSIPLAPGQKKNIATVEWDREDLTSRSESRAATEELSAFVSHDRDINEIANSSFRESIRGGSTAKTGAVGGGFGFAVGPLVLGGGGGSAWSSSTAWNDGSRNLTGQTLNQLRDDTSQGVSAVRSQRSTVVETVGQHERVTATTEVIANHNRCHAMTMQYFEVLRHFAVQERLAGVQECLFVPLQMTLFDDAKVLRWRDTLTKACRRRALRPGFESIWRLSSPATTPPNRAFADDAVEELSGRVFLRVSIARPKDPDAANEAVLEQTEWRFFGFILRVNPEVVYSQYRRNDQKRDQIFRTEIAPETARLFIESLRVVLIDRDGGEHDAGLDLTLLSRYSEGGLMEVSLNDTGSGPRLTRREIAGVEIHTDFELPEFSKVVVERASLDYRTERLNHFLYRNDRVFDDVLKGDPAFLSTSALTHAEERNQLKEDRQRRRKLLRHLNDNLEYFHRAMWWELEAARRFMLLDGFEAPNAGGRSVASVVENRLIGIVGNSMVLPVAPGFQLDPALRQALKRNQDPQKALETLYDMAPSPPRRHSVPTKGVFAEAMNGKCNSCEIIEEDRFWRWKDFPLPDSPPPISEVSTDTRFAAPGSLAPSAFPDALIKFQDIPTAPIPTGMQAALDLLGKDIFKDLTGLTENQKNAMAALTTAMGTSEAFAGEAFKLSMAQEAARNLDRTLGQIESANKAGLLTDEETSQATRDALLRSLGEDATQNKDVTELSGVTEALNQLGTAPSGSASVTRSSGENSETVSVTKDAASALTIGAKVVTKVADLATFLGIAAGIWVKTPLIKDEVKQISNKYEIRVTTRDIGAARGSSVVLDGNPAAGRPNVFIDIFQSALKAGFLRVDPSDATGSTFEIRANVQIGYPADPKDTKKIAPPAIAGTKYPLVVMVHGQSAAWTPTAPFPFTGNTHLGLRTKTCDLNYQANHEGYAYLQKFLAENGRNMISLSIETNYANVTDSHVEMRAQFLLDVLTEIEKLAGNSTSPLFEKIDFKNIGLMGHSRGGEAIVRLDEMLTGSSKFEVKAVCSLSPTDYRGFSDKPLIVNTSKTKPYLVVYGGMDQDVRGMKTAGRRPAGTGFRLYDRCSADKAMVFIPFACHVRFNTIWEASGTEGNTSSGVPIPIAATAIAGPVHKTLANEYIGGFFDMALNRDLARAGLFNNTKKNSVSKAAAIQWHFGTNVEVIEDFNDPPGTPVAGAGTQVVLFTPIDTPAGVLIGSRDMHVQHLTQACLIDLATVATPRTVIEKKFKTGTNLFRDLNGFDGVSFRLGVLYPVTNQPAIDAVLPPSFDFSVTDEKSKTHKIASAKVYLLLANGWVRPALKVIDTRNGTIMFLQTIMIDFKTLKANNVGTTVDYTRIENLRIDFATPTGTGEIWLDTIALFKK